MQVKLLVKLLVLRLSIMAKQASWEVLENVAVLELTGHSITS